MRIDNRRIHLLPLFALLLSFSAATAAPPPAETVSNPEITAAELRRHISYLASEELEGRGSGTRGADLAATYLADRFSAAGLQPAGEKGGFFQEFPVFTGVRLGKGNRLVFRGGYRKTAAVERNWMPVSFSANRRAAASLVFAGYGISRPDLKYDDYRGVSVKGKIVVILRHTPDLDPDGKFAPFARLSYKIVTAREKGAAGVLLVTGPLGDQPEDLGRFELDSDSADCGIPAAIVHRSLIEPLLGSRWTLKDLQVMAAHGTPKPVALPRIEAELEVQVERQHGVTRNVIGLLPGEDEKLRDELVVIGAHYDHLGHGGRSSLGVSVKPEIHYGADDNASGTAALMEIAHHLAAGRPRPARSILFIAFSGEEMGLLGSAHWVKNPTLPLSRVTAMINMDMIGRIRERTVHVMGAGTSEIWRELLKSAERDSGLTLKTSSSALSGFGGSDQQSFYVRDIPVLFFFSGSHSDYHRPTDTADKINVEDQQRLAVAIAELARRIAALPERPRFVRVSEPRQVEAGGFRVFLGTAPDYSAEAEGVTLSGVRPGSPAEKAGLKAGDLLVEFDGKKMRNVEEYTALLSAATPGRPVKIGLLRNGKRLDVTAIPAARD